MRYCGAAVGVIILALATAAAEGRDDKSGVFSPLEEGQKVVLKEAGDRYQITLIPGVEASHRVVEVGPDYIVLVDAAGVTETRIPIYAVKSVTVTRLPRK